MNRIELATLVVQNTGRTDKIPLINKSLIFAVKRMSELFPFLELRRECDTPIQPLDTQIQIPSWVDQIVELRMVDPATPTMSYPMELHREVWFVSRFPNVVGSTITGRPLYCYRRENLLFLDRKSSGDYICRLTATCKADLITDFSEVSIKDADEAIIAYATSSVYRSIQMYQDGQNWDQRFKELTTILVRAKERELGVHFVADMWSNELPIKPNQPWLDPFDSGRSYQ